MIYWENGDSVDSVGNMSKADILRGLVNEKLATAAREILAVVERTVAGYEEEASGFREEIDRQRRQLEAFQPKVKLERPDLHEYEAFAVHEGKVEQYCHYPVLEDTRTLSFDRQEEDEDEEEERIALSFSQIQDTDYPNSSRGLFDRVTDRCVLAENVDHLVLRVRMLEDSQTTVLSNSVFKKAPLLEMQCPRGLREAEFVDLLRSTFPQLAQGKIFDIFTTDRSKKLQPLKLKTLTPEEIDRSIKSTGAGRSTLYIRLKTGDALQSSSDDLGLLQRDKDAASDCPGGGAAGTGVHQTPACAVDRSDRRDGRRGPRVSTLTDSQCNVLSEYGVEDMERLELLCCEDGEEQGEEEMPGTHYDPNDVDYQVPSRSLFSRGSFEQREFIKSQFSDVGTHLYLRIRLLEDPQALVLSNTVLKRSLLQEVPCPLSMQEAEFLDLLRSIFPQLAGGEPFDVFITDKTKKLKPLTLKTLTPEAINACIKSSGGGNSALYIKLKMGQDHWNSHEHLHHRYRGDVIDDQCLKAGAGVTAGETKTCTVDPLQTTGDKLAESRYRVLRMCMLQDYHGDVLSKNVFMKCPVQKVKCTHGLQEPDFLVMLKSIFPQMTEDKNHFDIFRADKKRKLHRIKLKTLTPDTVFKCMKTFGSKKSTLYFRMKKHQSGTKSGESLRIRNVESLLQRDGEDTSSRRSATSMMVTANPNKMYPRDKPLRKRRRRGEEPSQHVLGVCLLQDSSCDVLSRFVFMKSPVHRFTCPRDLHEADFLDFLRTTFPQLHGDKQSFDIFRSDRSRKLQQLLVKTLTPDEIFNSLRSFGSAKTFYIKLKTEAQHQSNSDKPRLLQKHDDAINLYPNTPAMATTVHGNMHTVEEFKKKRRRRNEEPTHYVFRVCVVENPLCNVISRYVFQKSPLQEVKCARGLQEADFVNLLRTTFPQLDGDNIHFDILRTDKSRQLQKLHIKTLTPEEIYRSMKCFASGSRALYIRLKKSKDYVNANEEGRCLLPTNNDSVQDSNTSASLTVSHDEDRLHGRSPVETIGANKSDIYSTSESHKDADTEETNDGDDCGPSETMDRTESSVGAFVVDEIRRYEGNNGISHCKVNEALKDLRKSGSKWQFSNATRKRRARQLVKAKVIEKTKSVCKVCGISYMLMGRFIKHAWSHILSPEHLCGVCGERFESVETLKAHLKSYQKIHSCSFCGKSFLTALRLKLHITVHTGESPYKCDICHKAFTDKSSLTTHRWVHVADKPHKCGICQKAFGLQAQLKAHSKNHMNKKFCCKICGTFLSNSQSLARHKVCHTMDRKYGSQARGKHFAHAQGLKLHKRIHTAADRPNFCHICLKVFVGKSDLLAHLRTHPSGCGSQLGRPFIGKNRLKSPIVTHSVKKQFFCQVCGKSVARKQHLAVHMRTHSGEKPYHCTYCVKAFTQNHSLKKHMLSQHSGRNLSSEESKNIPQPVSL